MFPGKAVSISLIKQRHVATCPIDISANSLHITAARSTDSHWDLLPSTTREDCTPTRHPCSLSLCQPWAFVNTHTLTHFIALLLRRASTNSVPKSLKPYFPCRSNATPEREALRSPGDKMQSGYHRGFYLTDAAISSTGRLFIIRAPDAVTSKSCSASCRLELAPWRQKPTVTVTWDKPQCEEINTCYLTRSDTAQL